MAATKITKFIGIAPKLAAEHLPDVQQTGVSGAQVAFNTKVSSGDLVPYRRPRIVDNVGRTGPVNTIYALEDEENGGLKWLSFSSEVDIVIASEAETSAKINRKRFYYTGDGRPKVSTGDLALSGAGPYPSGFYILGLPTPDEKLNLEVTPFDVRDSVSYARDSANTATVVTDGPHGLRTGNIVSVRDFGTSDEAKSFNAVNIDINVVNDTTFTYFSPGDQVGTTGNTTGRIDLAGRTIPRSYVFTWFTPWAEESIASSPSDDVFLKEGQTVTVKAIPTTPPSDPSPNFVRGVRLYRSVVSGTGSEYFRLITLWFPTGLAKVARQGNVATVTLQHPHNFIEDDRFKISGCTDSSFDITDGEVTEVVDRFTFKFAQTGSNVAEKDETAGTIFHDVSEDLDKPARYWGDGGNFDFVDDFNISGLSRILDTEDYEMPPEDLRGLTSIQNNILAGFVKNKVYFSEPNRPHAWPSDEALVFEYDIVGLESVSGDLVVLTEGHPYRVSGNNPQTMVRNRVDAFYPCLSKESIVNMGYGVVYSTHGGLAVYNPVAGADLVTQLVHDWDTWPELLNPAEVKAVFFDGKYFGSYSEGNSFIFERSDQIGGFFVRINRDFTAAYTDPLTNILYYVTDDSGDVYYWDHPDERLTPTQWKSKAFILPAFINMGAARVVADYNVDEEELQIQIELNQQIIASNQIILNNNPQLGTINQCLLGCGLINGDPLTANLIELSDTFVVDFKLYADKKLVFERVVTNSKIFRLPLGYKTDTYEVEVSGRARIRSVHLGETPTSLREV